MAPKLSICIPTFNRANLLVSALTSLVPQVKELGGKVELLVSDNNSTDETKEIVERLTQKCPIRYHRNEVNVGVVRNVLKIVSLASGEFCWVMGDDELVRDGGVRKILGALEANPELDYFYVNYSMDSFERREGLAVLAEHFPKWTRTGNECVEERYVQPWQLLLGEDFSALTPIYSSVFRRSMWLEGAAGLQLRAAYNERVSFSNLSETFPHALIFARTMMNKRAWSSGYPWVIMCGVESWSEYIPVVVLLRFHELFDYYIKAGVDPRFIERHRRRMLGYASDPLRRLFAGEKLARLDGFSVLAFAGKHWRFRETWRALRDAAIAVPLRRVAKYSLPLALFAVLGKIWQRLRWHWARRRREPAAHGAQ